MMQITAVEDGSACLLGDPTASNWEELKEAVDKGLPVTELDHLKHTYNFTDETLAKLLGVSTRTILRRKSKHLTPDESTKIILLAKVLNKALDLMGSPENVLEWMHYKHPDLKQHSPIELCTNIVGYEQVINLLNKMEWGIPG